MTMKYLERVWQPEVVLQERDFLSAKECAAVRRAMTQAPAYLGTIVKRDGEPMVDTKVRRATNMDVSDEIRRHVDQRLDEIRGRLDAHFGIATVATQRTQFVVYRRGDYFRRHRDVAPESGLADLVSRKISVVLYLNDASTSDGCAFEGGVISFIGRFAGVDGEFTRLDVMPVEGMLLAFPPDLLHEVTRVSRGERFAAVSWLV